MTQDLLDNFIIEVKLIDPINKILNGLRGYEFRDCDITWLDNKLAAFTDIACKTLFIQIPTLVPTEKGKVLNEFTKKQYIERFTTLLTYFKTYTN